MSPEELRALYSRILASSGGDPGSAFDATELGRQGREPRLAGLPSEALVHLNRYAQSYDTPATALLAAPYEGLKAVEQRTGLPVLTASGRLLRRAGVPVALPNASTSPASGGNVVASLLGALDRLRGSRGSD